MQEIIKVEESIRHNLAVRDIYGLNIFRVNNVDCPISPNVVFLRSLCEQHWCSAHVGALALEGDTPGEFFDKSFLSKRSRTPVDLYNGLFFTTLLDSEPSFFLDAPPSLIEKHGDHLFGYDALALYLGDPENRVGVATKAQKLLGSPPLIFQEQISASENSNLKKEQGEEVQWQEPPWEEIHQKQTTWLHAIFDIYKIVILSASDGWSFTAYARETSSFELFSHALEKAVDEIKAHPWYIRNQDKLSWDAERDQCLKIVIAKSLAS